jgi:pimeloyl-ACP methyl ester carboxylesterase
MSQTGRTCGDAKVLGRRLHYVVRGSGAPVLLVHGLGATSFIWDAVDLPGFRLVAVDLPGCGGSEARPEATTLGDLAGILDAFMAEVSPGPYAMMGHSLGALICLEAALAHPDRVRAAVLIDAAIRLPRVARLGAAPGVGDLLFRLPDLVPLSRTAIRLYLSFVFGDRRRVTRDVVEAYARTAAAPGYYQAMLTGLRALSAWALGDRLATLQVPAAVVWGGRDRLFPPHLGRGFAQSLPGCSFQVIHDCGHSPPEEAPAELAARVRPFLDRHAPLHKEVASS